MAQSSSSPPSVFFHRREWVPAALLAGLLMSVRLMVPERDSNAARAVEPSFRNLFANEDRVHGVRRTVVDHCSLDERVLCSAAQRGDDPRCSRDRDGVPIDPPFFSMLDIHANPYECELNLEVAGTEFPNPTAFDHVAHKDMAIYHVIAYLLESMTRHASMHLHDEDSERTLSRYNHIMVSSLVDFFADRTKYGSKPLTINIQPRKDHGHSHGRHQEQIADAPTFQYIDERRSHTPEQLLVFLSSVMDYYRVNSAGGRVPANIDSALVIDRKRFQEGYKDHIVPDLIKMIHSAPAVDPTPTHELFADGKSSLRVFDQPTVDMCMRYHYARGTLVSDDCAHAMLAGARRIQELDYVSVHTRVEASQGRWCVWLALASVLALGLTLGAVWNQFRESEEPPQQYLPLGEQHKAPENRFPMPKNQASLLRFVRIGMIAVWCWALVVWIGCVSVHRNDWIDASIIALMGFLGTYLMAPDPNLKVSESDMELSLVVN